MSIHIGAHAQGYAVSIEHILCDVFGCQRFGFGGIVNSDFIRKQPFPAMLCGLSFIYATAGKDKQTEIIKFIEEYSFFSEMSLDLLLSFDTSTKNIDGITIELSFENGENAVENMIEDFRKVCKRK
ncbi:MAG: hypothetical protein AB7G87_03900 [Clostridia bacterium]